MNSIPMAVVAVIGGVMMLTQPSFAANPQKDTASPSIREVATSMAANDESGPAFRRRHDGAERGGRDNDRGRPGDYYPRREMSPPGWRREATPSQQPNAIAEFHFARGNARIDIKCPTDALQPCVSAAGQLIGRVLRMTNAPSASGGTKVKPDNEGDVKDDDHQPEGGT